MKGRGSVFKINKNYVYGTLMHNTVTLCSTFWDKVYDCYLEFHICDHLIINTDLEKGKKVQKV